MADIPFEGKLKPAQVGEKLADTGDINETDDKLFITQAEKDQISAGSNTVEISDDPQTTPLNAYRIDFTGIDGIDTVIAGHYVVKVGNTFQNDGSLEARNVKTINFPSGSGLTATVNPTDSTEVDITAAAGTEGVEVGSSDTTTNRYQKLVFTSAELNSDLLDPEVIDIKTGTDWYLSPGSLIDKRIVNIVGGNYLDIDQSTLNDKGIDLEFTGIDVQNGLGTGIRTRNIRIDGEYLEITDRGNKASTLNFNGIDVGDGVAASGKAKELIFDPNGFNISDTGTDQKTIGWVGASVSQGTTEFPNTKEIVFNEDDFKLNQIQAGSVGVSANEPIQYLAYKKEEELIQLDGTNYNVLGFNDIIYKREVRVDETGKFITIPASQGVYFICWNINTIGDISFDNPSDNEAQLTIAVQTAGAGATPITDIYGNSVVKNRVVVFPNENVGVITLSAFILAPTFDFDINFTIKSSVPLKFAMGTRTEGGNGLCIQQLNPEVNFSESLLQFSIDTQKTFSIIGFPTNYRYITGSEWLRKPSSALQVIGPDAVTFETPGITLYSGAATAQYEILTGTFGYVRLKDNAVDSYPYYGSILNYEQTLLLRGVQLTISANDINISEGQGVDLLLMKYTGAPDSYYDNVPKLITGVQDTGGGVYQYTTATDWSIVDGLNATPGETTIEFNNSAPSDANNLAVVIVPSINQTTGAANPFDFVVRNYTVQLQVPQELYRLEELNYGELYDAYLVGQHVAPKTIPDINEVIPMDTIKHLKNINLGSTLNEFILSVPGLYIIEIDFSVQTSTPNTNFIIRATEFNGATYANIDDSGDYVTFATAGYHKYRYTYFVRISDTVRRFAMYMTTSDISGCTLEPRNNGSVVSPALTYSVRKL